MKRKTLWMVALTGCLLAGAGLSQLTGAARAGADEPTRLAVVWTSGDADVMYVHNSQKRGWFDQNLLIVWGPSARLLAGDKELQATVKEMIKDGVTIQACKACADMYGVAPALSGLGVEVKYMGQPLTNILQDDGWEVMAF